MASAESISKLTSMSIIRPPKEYRTPQNIPTNPKRKVVTLANEKILIMAILFQ